MLVRLTISNRGLGMILAVDASVVLFYCGSQHKSSGLGNCAPLTRLTFARLNDKYWRSP
jgi:hypothetical protein